MQLRRQTKHRCVEICGKNMVSNLGAIFSMDNYLEDQCPQKSQCDARQRVMEPKRLRQTKQQDITLSQLPLESPEPFFHCALVIQDLIFLL